MEKYWSWLTSLIRAWNLCQKKFQNLRMKLVAFVHPWTRLLAKNKIFSKILVHYYIETYAFFPKNSYSRPIFQFFWGPKPSKTKISSPAPQSMFLLWKPTKNGSSISIFKQFLIFLLLHAKNAILVNFSHFWRIWVITVSIP